MAYPAAPYIEERSGCLYLAGTRVSLDPVLINFRRGASPEKIGQAFSSLELSQVCGAIAYYLENQETINSYLRKASDSSNQRLS